MILVTISNYTAQVTLYNVVGASTGTINTFAEGKERGYRFCGWASLQTAIEATYPDLVGRYVPLENGEDGPSVNSNTATHPPSWHACLCIAHGPCSLRAQSSEPWMSKTLFGARRESSKRLHGSSHSVVC